MLFVTCQVQAGMPELTVDGVDTSGTDPIKMAKELGGALFSLGLSVVLGFLALTIIKNGWQKYNETGEDGSKSQLKDAFLNMVFGVVILVASLVLGRWGVASFT